jgi:hypothetical protein
MPNTSLSRTPSSTTNRKTYTFSAWVKLCEAGGNDTILNVGPYDGSKEFRLTFNGSSQLEFYDYNGSSYEFRYRTDRLFRDPSAWYHIVVLVSTIDVTASDRIRIYVNGVRETSFNVSTAPSQNLDTNFNVNNIFYVGSASNGNYTNGCLSHINFCDGQAYDANDFGETDATTGEWKIKTSPSVTYGTNGFFILKDDNSLTDQSGNSNNFTLASGTLTKTEDCPSNVFATWNPLQATTSASYDFSAGNTRMAVNDTAVFSLGATLAATTGKYYMEMKWVQQGGNGSWGMIPIDTDINNRPRDAGVGWNQNDNVPYLLGSTVSGSWGGSIGTNDIIQLAMDLDNGAFYFGKNGTYLNSGNPTSGSSKTGAVDFSGTSLFGEQLTFAIGKGASGTDGWNANFGNGYFEQTAVSSAGTNASGNGIFEYDVPTGYTALSTKGLNL